MFGKNKIKRGNFTKKNPDEFLGSTGDYRLVSSLAFLVIVGLLFIALYFAVPTQPSLWITGTIIITVSMVIMFSFLFVQVRQDKQGMREEEQKKKFDQRVLLAQKAWEKEQKALIRENDRIESFRDKKPRR